MGRLGSSARKRPSDQYETVLKNIHDAVYMLDKDGRISWVNEVAFEEFEVGYSREELIGAQVSKVLSQEDITKCANIITDIIESKNRDSGRCEIQLQTKTGGEIPCDLRLTPLLTADGEIEGTIGVLRDVTDRNRREEGLMVLNRALRHNLRNRLNVIIGLAESLKKSEGMEHPHLDEILEAARELDRLGNKTRRVGNLLSSEKWSLEQVNVVDIIKSQCRHLQRDYPNAEIFMELPDEAPIQGNPRLGIVIENLLENAIEHSDHPSTPVKVSVNGENGNWVEIRIADKGPGIPQNELQSIIQGEETPLEHGSGLGLWEAKWIVERCDGELEFQERPSNGSIAIVRLQSAES